MPRRLLTRRWLGLTVLALVLVAACVRLGFWQLDRARDVQRSERAAEDTPAVALQTLVQPRGQLPTGAVGRLVTVSGVYDRASYVVPGRPSAGRDGSWVVSLLRTPAGDGVVVVRGWTAGVPARAPDPAPGEVTVTGRLSPAEHPGGDTAPGTRLPAGQLPAVDPVDLLPVVAYPVYDGYVVPVSQQPPDPAALRAVPAASPTTDVPGFFLQHVAYVGLWWLFALFVVLFWVRLLRDDLAEEHADPAARLPA